MRVCHRLICNTTIELVLLLAVGCTYFFLALSKLSFSVENEVQDVQHVCCSHRYKLVLKKHGKHQFCAFGRPG